MGGSGGRRPGEEAGPDGAFLTQLGVALILVALVALLVGLAVWLDRRAG